MVDAICRVESHEFLYWKTSVADAGALVEKKQNGFIKLSQCRASGAVPAREGFTQQGGRKVYQLSFFFSPPPPAAWCLVACKYAW